MIKIPSCGRGFCCKAQSKLCRVMSSACALCDRRCIKQQRARRPCFVSVRRFEYLFLSVRSTISYCIAVLNRRCPALFSS